MLGSKEKLVFIFGSSAAVCGVLAYLWYRRKQVDGCSSCKNASQEEVHGQPEDKYQDRPEEPDVEEASVKKVLVLGLDGSGKSAVVASLCGNRPQEDFAPTHGFSVVTQQCGANTKLELWEIGGQEETRRFWNNFFKKTDVVVYVVDASNSERFAESRKALQQIAQDDRMTKLPYILVANKMDVDGAASVDELAQSFKADGSPVVQNVQIVSTQVPFSGRHSGVNNLFRIINELTS